MRERSKHPPLDQEVINRAKAGDQSAWQTLTEYSAPVIKQIAIGYRFARREPEDVVQDVMVLVFRNLDKFREEANYRTWLCTIAANQCNDYCRKDRIRKELREGDVTQKLEQEEPIPWDKADPAPRIDRQLLSSQFAGKLLKRIPSDLRSILLLKEVEGLSIKELHDRTGENENTLKVQIFRAKQMLKKAAGRLLGNSGLERLQQEMRERDQTPAAKTNSRPSLGIVATAVNAVAVAAGGNDHASLPKEQLPSAA